MLFLTATSCVSPPVEEVLELCFGPDGGVVVRLEVSFPGEQGSDGSALAERIAQRRRELEDDSGHWARRFEALPEPLADGIEVVRVERRIERFRRWSVIEDASRLPVLFAEAPLDAIVVEGDEAGPSELILVPTAGDLATRAERERVEDMLDELSEALEDYLRRLSELYAYLAESPERAPAVLDHLLTDVLEQDARSEISRREERLVRRCLDAEEPLLELFEIDGDEAFTLQESSRRVFDPFPSDLRVRVPGRVVDSAGFVEVDGVWRARRVGFWDAVERLEGLWVSPDPLLAKVRHWRAGEDDFSVDDFIADRVFEARAPTSGEVVKALLHELGPWEEYRLVWWPDPDRTVCERELEALGEL